MPDGEAYNPAITDAWSAPPTAETRRLQNPTLQNPSTLQNPTLQNPVLQNDAVANPSIVNAVDPEPARFRIRDRRTPRLQNPRLQNPRCMNAAISDTSWEVSQRGQHHRGLHRSTWCSTNPVPAGFITQLVRCTRRITTPAALGVRRSRSSRTRSCSPTFPIPSSIAAIRESRTRDSRTDPEPDAGAGARRNGDDHVRVVDPNSFDGVAFDAARAVTPAAVAQSVNTEEMPRTGTRTPTVAMPLTITTASSPPATPGAPLYPPSLQTSPRPAR